MKKYFLLSCSLAVFSAVSYAQINEQTCEPLVQRDLYTPNAYKHIYPFKPLDTQIINCRIKRLTESTNAINDLREIDRRGLKAANTKVQPWGGSYWPMFQGLIANDYQNKTYDAYIYKLSSWKKNYNKYLKRTKDVHSRIYEIDEKGLAELSPSEKYDLLLGDTSFDLTNKVWNYTSTWAANQWGYLSSIDLPEGYRIPEKRHELKDWEGICHGWAVASGASPRPENTVWVTLKNGKRMPFYPSDLKALVSMMWANSNVQDNVISEGFRCNKSSPDKDEHGRYFDRVRDFGDKSLLPRCADVHPAVYHTAIVNVLGVEGRSFVIDKSAVKNVANQPVSGYEYRYFNPATGTEGTLEESALSVATYEKDPFKESRNKDTKFIVGVDMTLKYIALENPKAIDTNGPQDDVIKNLDFNYDLELDQNFKVIGGQWRVKKNGSSRVFNNSTGQPDFFWIIPKDHKKYFTPNPTLPKWDFAASTVPPTEFLPAAKGAHSYIYQMTRAFGFNEKCRVEPISGNSKATVMVPCEFKYPKPQPLLNVVETLVQESRR